MDGRIVTFSALGALLVASAVQSGHANRRPKFRAVGKIPAGFTTSPWPFVQGTSLVGEEEDPARCDGLYHVTTNLPAVLEEGRLLARSQLKAPSAGLGGGLRNQAPDRVSVAVQFDQARRIQKAIVTMARAVHGQIGAEEALAQMKEASAPALDAFDRALEFLYDGDEDHPAAKAVEAALVGAARDARVAESGFTLYDALRRYEQILAEAVTDWRYEGWINEDELVCGSTVGFTEPAVRFRRVRPENVGLLRLAARKGVEPELVPDECELRFRSADLAIVGVWEGGL